jgi:predicted O-methyltransferase YrrM
MSYLQQRAGQLAADLKPSSMRRVIQNGLRRLRAMGDRLTGGGLRSLARRVLRRSLPSSTSQPFPVSSTRVYHFSTASDSPDTPLGTGAILSKRAPEPNYHSVLVNSFYKAAFGRAADEVGLAHWTHQLQSGLPPEVLAEQLVGSAEFQSRHGPNQRLDNEFLTALYRDGLGRQPDPEGLAHWLAEGEKGASRAKVLAAFAGSSEALQQKIIIVGGVLGPLRRSTVFPTEELQPEYTEGIAGKSGQLWSMFDVRAAESEVLDFLYALVRMVKPGHAVETGTWLGRSAIAIGSAMRDNGFGHLSSLEVDPEPAGYAATRVRAAGLEVWVEIVTDDSLNYRPPSVLQFALLDSAVGLRAKEFRHFYEHLEHGATVVFHDTGVQFPGNLADAIRELIAEGLLLGSFYQTPRGIFVGSVQRPPESHACE